jgi:hypothetical protein
MSTSFAALLSFEVTVFANVGNCRENFRQWAPLSPSQRRLQDFTMLLLRAAIAFRRPLFERLDELIR